MTSLQIYLWLMLDNVRGLVLSPLFVMVFGIFGGIAIYFINCGYEVVSYGSYPKLNKKLLTLCLVNFLFWVSVTALGIFIPTSKQMATIIVLPKVANSEFAQEIPDDMMNMYNMAKEYVKEKLSDGHK